MATVVNALALMRFGGGRGGDAFLLLVGFVVMGVAVWALTRTSGRESAKE